MSEQELKRKLRRSEELEAAVWSVLPDTFTLAYDSRQLTAALTATLMAVEHARACRLLIEQGMYTTGIGIIRMQFEALVRGMWLLYAANEDEARRATATLSEEAQQEASSLPMAAKMIEALKGRAPAGMFEMMSSFKDTMLKALHSFVHAGVHPLQRHLVGYPEALLNQVVSNSNGLFVATGAFLAILAGDQSAMRAMSQLQVRFSDCLPQLLRAGPTN